ncbi:hypothetical protein [Celeribacter sp. ULVN23_4]
MSYSPEPDPREELPKLTAFADRVAAFYKNKPIKFWGLLWLLSVIVVSLKLMMGGLNGLDHFMASRNKALLAYALVGWIYPLFLFVRARSK